MGEGRGWGRRERRRPRLIKDIKALEQVQRRATKFILNDYTMDYKERLVQLDMLPLMYIILELNDIFFCVKPLKDDRSEFFNLIDYTTCSTRSGSAKKMNVPRQQTTHTALLSML